MNRIFMFTGALLAMLAVIFGAFGAHALKATINPVLFDSYQIAVQYHFLHALGLILIGLMMTLLEMKGRSLRLFKMSGLLVFGGVFLFSGSLYALALSGHHWLGIITPIGGVCFILGWLSLAIAVK